MRVTVEIVDRLGGNGRTRTIEFDPEEMDAPERSYWAAWLESGAAAVPIGEPDIAAIRDVINDSVEMFWARVQERERKEKEGAQAAGDRWRAEAWRRTNTLPPSVRALPELYAWFNRALAAFDDSLKAGRFPDLKTSEELHDGFRKFFLARLSKMPAVTLTNRFADKELRAALGKSVADYIAPNDLEAIRLRAQAELERRKRAGIWGASKKEPTKKPRPKRRRA